MGALLRNTMKLGQTSFIGFASQFFSSILGFLATVYITRMLGSSVFGEYMLVISLVLWLQIVGVLGIKNAVTKRLSGTGESGTDFTAGTGFTLGAFSFLSFWECPSRRRSSVTTRRRGTSLDETP